VRAQIFVFKEFSRREYFLGCVFLFYVVKMVFFRQIRGHGDNFSYVIADEVSKEAVVVDSSFNSSEIRDLIKAQGFVLRYIVNTHGHSDHVAGNYALQAALGGEIVAHGFSQVRSNLQVEDGEVLCVGSVVLKVIYTPGHTNDGICLLINGEKLLTGDTLFVGECGRTDFPGGSSAKLYDSLFNKLAVLGDGVEVYPGHDYGAKPFSTVGEEKRSNYVLEPRSLEEFVVFMSQP
jgi:hydroxyacylglutathione hydrolase